MAFSGYATYDDTSATKEDVRDIIMIVRRKTRILNAFEMSDAPAGDVIHSWVEEKQSPGTIINSTAIASATAQTAFEINGLGGRLQKGDLLEFLGGSSVVGREQMQVASIVGASSIVVDRGIGGVGPSSLAAGGSIELIANAALEGSDLDTNDISRPSTRQSNTVQIFRKPITISDSREAILQYGVESEFARQETNRVEENMRDLEKALLRGVDSSTRGGDATYRRMGGLWSRITTNVTTFATISASAIDNLVIKPVVNKDHEDVDLMILDNNFKLQLDSLQDGRVRTAVDEETFGSVVSFYKSGLLDREILCLPSNNMMTNSLILTSRSRVKVVPLRTMAFHTKRLARTGSAEKGMVQGEYTVEIWHEDGMSKAYKP
jgi:hypothetical protein